MEIGKITDKEEALKAANSKHIVCPLCDGSGINEKYKDLCRLCQGHGKSRLISADYFGAPPSYDGKHGI